MAPRIDRLFDHQLRIWRATIGQDSLGAETRTYAVTLPSIGAVVNRAVAAEGDIGPGMEAIGRVRFYVRPDVEIFARDVVEIVSGPETGTFEVDQPPVRPRGHHTQVDAIIWNGILPAIAES